MINLLISTQRSSLRQACLDQMAAMIKNWPDKRAIMIVPEQTKMDTEQAFLAVNDQPGLMLAEILSFRRLAWRLAGEIGVWPQQAVDAVGQAMLIQRILRQNKQDMKILGELGEKPGYITQIASVLGDLKRYQADPVSLLLAGDKIGDAALRQKATDFGLLLQKYDQALARAGLSDAEEDLARLAELLRDLAEKGFSGWPRQRLEWLKRTSIWINGFGELRDFTPQEIAIIKYLSQITAQLNISLAADFVPANASDSGNGPEMFSIGRKSAWNLHRNLPVAKIIRIDEDLHGSAALTALCLRGSRQKLPQPKNEAAGKVADYIRLLKAPDEDNEIMWVAGEIRRLVQEDGYRYRDISVAACDLKKAAPRMRAAFRLFNIPLFLDQDRSLAGTPLMRLVFGILNLGVSGWTRWPVMSFLRSGLVRADQDDLDLLENFLLAKGLYREDRLFADRNFAEAGSIGHNALRLREELLLPVRELLGNLRKTRSAPGKCLLLQKYLDNTGIPQLIESRSASLVAQGESEAAVNLVKSWNELDRIMVQMVQLTEGSEISFTAFRDMLAAAAESARSGIIPTAVDQVNVGDLRRGYLQTPKVLFIVGATAESLPPAWPPEGLLKDLDRQALAENLNLQLPSHGRDRAGSDGFLIYTLLTLPRQLLYMSVAGNKVSPWYTYLAELYPDREIFLPGQPEWDDPRLASPRTALSYYLAGSQAGIITETAQEDGTSWLAWREVLEKNGLLDKREMAEPGDPAAVRLPPDEIEKFYGDKMGMSVSQLEQYAGCPFLHLAGYLLDLRERTVWEPEKAETGILLHSTLELAFRDLLHELQEAGAAPAAVKEVYQRWLDSDLEERALTWLRQAACLHNLQRIMEQGLRASAGRRARRLAGFSLSAMLQQFMDAEFLPAQLEWTFGMDSRGVMELHLDNGRLVDFRGKVDRIDLAQAEKTTYFRIVDYKSGDKRIDYDALYHGLSLQLPLYLEAYSRQYPEYKAFDAAYHYLDRPMITLNPDDSPDQEKIARKIAGKTKPRNLGLDSADLDRLRLHAWHKAEILTKDLAEGIFTVSPARLQGRPPLCSWCRYLPVCGFNRQSGKYRWLPAVNQLCGGGTRKKQAFLRCLLEEEQNEIH